MPRLSQIAEALYQVRGVLEDGGTAGNSSACLRYAETALRSYLTECGCVPGESARDADLLKLDLMRAKREGGDHIIEREVDVIESFIGEAMLADNAIAEWKMVSRFATFCKGWKRRASGASFSRAPPWAGRFIPKRPRGPLPTSTS